MDYKLEIIAKEVCIEFELTMEELFSKTRKSEIVIARKVFYNLCRKYTELTYENIGACSYKDYGFKLDHATIIHSVKSIDEILPYDKYLRSQYNNVDMTLNIMFNGDKVVSSLTIGLINKLRNTFTLENLSNVLTDYLLLTKEQLDEHNSKLYSEEVAAKIKNGFLKLAKKN
jgi:hypothetical protein